MPKKLNPDFLRTRVLADLLAQAKRKNLDPLPKTTIPLRKALLQLDYADDQDYIGAGPGNPTTFSRFIVGGPQVVAQQRVQQRVAPQVVAQQLVQQRVVPQVVAQQRVQQRVGPQVVAQQRVQQRVGPQVVAQQRVAPQAVAQQRVQQRVVPQVVAQQRVQQVVARPAGGRKPKWLTKAFFRNKSPQDLREQCKRLNIVAKTKAEMVDALYNYAEYMNGEQFGGAKVAQAVVQQGGGAKVSQVVAQQGGAKVAQAIVQQGGAAVRKQQEQQPKQAASQQQARQKQEIIDKIRKCIND